MVLLNDFPDLSIGRLSYSKCNIVYDQRFVDIPPI